MVSNYVRVPVPVFLNNSLNPTTWQQRNALLEQIFGETFKERLFVASNNGIGVRSHKYKTHLTTFSYQSTTYFGSCNSSNNMTIILCSDILNSGLIRLLYHVMTGGRGGIKLCVFSTNGSK